MFFNSLSFIVLLSILHVLLPLQADDSSLFLSQAHSSFPLSLLISSLWFMLLFVSLPLVFCYPSTLHIFYLFLSAATCCNSSLSLTPPPVILLVHIHYASSNTVHFCSTIQCFLNICPFTHCNTVKKILLLSPVCNLSLFSSTCVSTYLSPACWGDGTKAGGWAGCTARYHPGSWMELATEQWHCWSCSRHTGWNHCPSTLLRSSKTEKERYKTWKSCRSFSCLP